MFTAYNVIKSCEVPYMHTQSKDLQCKMNKDGIIMVYVHHATITRYLGGGGGGISQRAALQCSVPTPYSQRVWPFISTDHLKKTQQKLAIYETPLPPPTLN
jgi:hypothetical protein